MKRAGSPHFSRNQEYRHLARGASGMDRMPRSLSFPSFFFAQSILSADNMMRVVSVGISTDVQRVKGTPISTS